MPNTGGIADTGGVDDHSEDPSTRPRHDAGSVCPRHPDRVSYLRCRSCGRPACAECQHPVVGGFDCADCVPDAAPDRLASEGAPTASPPAAAPTAAPGVNPPWRGPTDPTGPGAGAPPGSSSSGSLATPTGAEAAERPARPVVTYTIAGLCLLVYLWQRIDPRVIDLGDFSPISGYVEPWRFLTAAFLHSPDSVSHLLFNMMSLWAMGQFLEPALGRARYTALYLLSALGGSVGCLLLVPALDVWDQAATMAWFRGVVGASGAVFGLFTAVFLVLRRSGASVAGMVVLLGINAALPFIYRNIAWQAHLGGAVVGLVVTAIFLATARPVRARWTWPALAAVAVALVGVSVAKYAANIQALQYLTSLAGGSG